MYKRVGCNEVGILHVLFLGEGGGGGGGGNWSGKPMFLIS